MSEPFIGQIMAFAGSFVPAGWAVCGGQLLSVQSNTVLFSIIGVRYGGNGVTNFALPNLSGRIPVGQGWGPGLSPWEVGQVSGQAVHTLTTSQLPMHTHSFRASNQGATVTAPNGGASELATTALGPRYVGAMGDQELHPSSVAHSGGQGLAHTNLMPSLVVTYCIALRGAFPSYP